MTRVAPVDQRGRSGRAPDTRALQPYAGGVHRDDHDPARRTLTVRSVLARLTRSQSTVQAVEESERAKALGGTPCAALTGRSRVQIAGSLRSVTLRPRAGVPALEAEIFDGTGSVALIWLGRREIVGIEAGRRLRVEGLVACSDGRKVMYNPTYELAVGPAA